MGLFITLKGPTNAAVSADLADLIEQFRQGGLEARPITSVVPGDPSALISGTVLMDLTLPGITKIVAVLTAWEAQKAAYDVLLAIHGRKPSVAELSPREFEMLIASEPNPKISIERL